MKKILTESVFLSSTFITKSQTIYSKTFGNPYDKLLIYLHGGSGYNSVDFESTTTQKLFENGFYVISYDKCGEGRSPDKKDKFNFNEFHTEWIKQY